MKKLILIFITLLVVGCCAGCANNAVIPVDPIVNKHGDTAQQAAVREWLTMEVLRIYEKRAVIQDMFNSGQISYEEYFLLMEECDREKAGIVPRAEALFR